MKKQAVNYGGEANGSGEVVSPIGYDDNEEVRISPEPAGPAQLPPFPSHPQLFRPGPCYAFMIQPLCCSIQKQPC